jgi:hypothetical protein
VDEVAMMKNNKLIAVRVPQELYDKIKVCADYANNSMCGWCELLIRQGVSKVYGMIPNVPADSKPLGIKDNKEEK